MIFRNICTFTIAFFLWFAFAANLYADFVVPSANTSVEGDANLRFPFFVDGGIRFQQVYDASQFDELSTGGGFLTGMWLRPDEEFGGSFGPLTIVDLAINLSTTPQNPDDLFEEFAANIGVDNTTVVNGSITISSGNLPGPGNTRAFDIFIGFDTPFFYDPANGNLLLDVLNEDPANNNAPPLFFDAVATPGDSVSRVWWFEGDPGVTFGNTDTVGLVTKFAVGIPEPSSTTLLGVCLIGGWMRRRGR